MKHKFFFLFVIFGCFQLPAFAQMIQGGAAGTICNAQGAPTYCKARTDVTFVPIPGSVPSVGASTGAGACIHQPGYANEVCRVTDINSETGSTGIASRQNFTACCGGSADFPEWSADSRLFSVEDEGASIMIFMLDDSVDPPIISCIGPGNVLVTPATNCETVQTYSGVTAGSIAWSASNPLVFFAGEGTSQIHKITLPASFVGAPTDTQLFDLATAPNCAPSAGGASLGPFRASWNDQDFAGIYSPFGQGDQFQLFYYDLTNGCRWLNTITGQIGGNWGPTGTANINASQPISNSAITSGIATITVPPTTTSRPLSIVNPSTFTITNATNASPIVLTTSTACGNCNNLVIGVSGVAGNTAANGTWLASASGTSITLLHLDQSNSTGNGAYTSGGTVYDGMFISVSGLTHCTACNGGPFAVTGDTSTTISYVAPSADVASGADSGTAEVHTQLHETTLTGDGQTALLSPGGATNTMMFWQANSLNVNAQQASAAANITTGHYAFMYTNRASNTQTTVDGNFCHQGYGIATMPLADTVVNLTTNTANCGWVGAITSDSHDSVTTLSHSDRFPVYVETIDNSGSAPANAWMQEVYAQSTAKIGTTWRFCSTYENAHTGSPFPTTDGVGTVSPNGKWFVFSSDWESTLGVDASSHERSDVFLCRLK